MQAVRAQRIMTMNPDQPEVFDGGMLIDDDRIVSIDAWEKVRSHGLRVDLGNVTIVPGFINAHTHLELSHLAGRIPAGLGFMGWADELFRQLRQSACCEDTLRAAVHAVKDSGTFAVVDIANRYGTLTTSILKEQNLTGMILQEYAGRSRSEVFTPDMPVEWGCAVHALYSTAVEHARRIKDWCRANGRIFSIHLAEVPGENELFKTGAGEFSAFLRQRKILPGNFSAPGCRAVQHAFEMGLLDANTLAVHCVHINEHDAELLKRSGVTVCLCPRSNAWIGVGQAPVDLLLRHDIPFCLGTDSLASNGSLDLRDELRTLALAKGVLDLHDYVAAVTTVPADILGLSADLGSLEPGKLARWVVLPADFASMSS